MPQPTFFLVGAPKAGTTSLFRYLGQHPEIAVAAVKEPCYFAPEVPVDATTDAHRRSWDAYLSLFAGGRGKHVIGEGSVAYLGSPGAAAAIQARIPDAKILMMLRDPADRLFSHYAASQASTSVTFDAWIAAQQKTEAGRTPIYGAVWAGNYATHLARFRSHFPREQVHVSYYDDFVSEPDAELARIFAFLRVDPAVTVDRTVRHNVTTVPILRGRDLFRGSLRAMLDVMLPASAVDEIRQWSREPSRLEPSASDRAHGIALYRNEIEALSRDTGRDLTDWLR